MNEKQILDALRMVEDPDLKKDLVSLGMVRDIAIRGNEISFTLQLTTPACPMKDMIKKACTTAITKIVNPEAQVKINLDNTPLFASKHNATFENIKNIFVVYSAKGGVGKSTVAACLATSLAQEGARVGLVDADIYGPSIPVIFDIENPEIEVVVENGKNKLIPFQKNGVYLMSLGFLTQKNQAAVWRGPMASTATRQLIFDVKWPDLDYLIIDMPPGTGDVHLTVLQSLKPDGVIIVTTPHKMAIEDTRRAIAMLLLESMQIPIVGLVENMSYHQLEETSHKQYIFGQDGGKHLAEEFGLIFLGQIPISSQQENINAFLDKKNHTFISAFDEFVKKTVRIQSMKSANFNHQTIQKTLQAAQ